LGSLDFSLYSHFGGLIVGLMRGAKQTLDLGFPQLQLRGGAARHWSPDQSRRWQHQFPWVAGFLRSRGTECEISANFGMLLGQVLQMSQERQRFALGAGAAAGLAAGFNAPIAGVFFALEVVLGTTFATSAVSVVPCGGGSSVNYSDWLGGSQRLLYPFTKSSLEFPLYMGLGVFASLVSITYTQSLRLAEPAFR